MINSAICYKYSQSKGIIEGPRTTLQVALFFYIYGIRARFLSRCSLCQSQLSKQAALPQFQTGHQLCKVSDPIAALFSAMLTSPSIIRIFLWSLLIYKIFLLSEKTSTTVIQRTNSALDLVDRVRVMTRGQVLTSLFYLFTRFWWWYVYHLCTNKQPVSYTFLYFFFFFGWHLWTTITA